jgi:hypothetical protein
VVVAAQGIQGYHDSYELRYTIRLRNPTVVIYGTSGRATAGVDYSAMRAAMTVAEDGNHGYMRHYHIDSVFLMSQSLFTTLFLPCCGGITVPRHRKTAPVPRLTRLYSSIFFQTKPIQPPSRGLESVHAIKLMQAIVRMT